MKRTVSVMLIACVVALPLTGCAARRGPRVVGETSGGRVESESDWSRVSRLQPAAEITVALNGAPPASRYFVTANDSALVVLNLTTPALSSSTARTLRDMAAQHPDHIVPALSTGAFRQGDVTIGRDGVFVSDRKVAELGQILETIPRGDVNEIWGPVIARGSVPGTLIGGWLGFAVGAVPALGGAPAELGWLIALGSTAAGGYLGFRSSSHETHGI